MSVQYLSDEKGRVTAVQLPIKEWEIITNKYPELAHVSTELPDWQKNIIDIRLKDIQNNPDQIKPISGLLDELNR